MHTLRGQSGAGAHALQDASRIREAVEQPQGFGVRARQRRFPPHYQKTQVSTLKQRMANLTLCAKNQFNSSNGWSTLPALRGMKPVASGSGLIMSPLLPTKLSATPTATPWPS